ncbi:uncharacterized protein LOC129587285 [Paramacrobiotus metropolitanus]|uniref:uncharacterized protein LOC129587285 n=1 Tax=Paramacrobiotus metropolitanus TaxID=2943436 RepID=UPI00244585F6|nr:uncharacterized protein LOC129587285 [Paramacrobiotus metropolitanus]
MDVVGNVMEPDDRVPVLAHPEYNLEMPKNATAFMRKMSDDKSRQCTFQLPTSLYANSLLPVLTRELKKSEPHPWMVVGPESHYATNSGRMDLAVHVSPSGRAQFGDSLVAWIHESKPGFVWVDQANGKKEKFLHAESRRINAGEQLRERFCEENLVGALCDYDWDCLWGSSGAGIDWAIWYMDPNKRTIYRVFCPTDETAALDPNEVNRHCVYPLEFWNFDVQSSHFPLALCYAHNSIMEQLATLKVKPQEDLDALNMRELESVVGGSAVPQSDKEQSGTHSADFMDDENVSDEEDESETESMDVGDTDYEDFEDDHSRSSEEDKIEKDPWAESAESRRGVAGSK